MHKVQNDRYALSATRISDTDNGTLVELSHHFLLYPMASVFRNSGSAFVSALAPRLTYVTFPPLVEQPRNPIAHHTRSGEDPLHFIEHYRYNRTNVIFKVNNKARTEFLFYRNFRNFVVIRTLD